LGNGRPAELRLLYGDGILGPDPVRPVVVGEQGEIYALGPHGEAVAFTCAEQDCRVFIFMAGASLPYVFILDRATFRSEPVYRFSSMIPACPTSPNGRKRPSAFALFRSNLCS
jgi:hypothetical protein